MISLSQLYTQDDRRGARTTWQHHMGLMQVCQTADSGTLDTVRGLLQMTSLTFNNVAVDAHPKYLLGRDARGFQVSLLTNFGTNIDVWRAAMQAGLANDAAIADRALKYCIDAATTIFNDLNPRIPANIEVLFFGHGIAGGILAILREKLRVAGKRVSNLWQTSAPRFCTEETADGITLPAARYVKLEDAYCSCPPSSIMVNWDPPGTVPDLYTIGETFLQARFGVDATRQLIVPAAGQDPLGWVDYISPDLGIFANIRFYALRHWYTMNSREQAVSIEWFNLLNNVFGYTLERRLS